jgi:mono/diheme cytochrome c family protein
MRAHVAVQKWVLAAVGVSLLCAGTHARAREWNDTSGKFRTEADFVASRNGKVILEKTDGSIITIPLEKLSEEDQAYVRSQTAEKPTPATKPESPKSEPAPGSDNLAEAAQAVLRTSCYRCHGQEGTSEGGFNFVLNLEKLRRTHVKPQAPGDSLLWERMTADDDSVMPPPDEKTRPSAADIATVKAWIEAGAPATAAVKPRDFVSNDEVIKHILANIRAAPERSRRFLRYFTLTHLYNALVSDDELRTYHNAFLKLINSLSWNTDLLVPEAIDPAATIWRVDIRQLNWSGEVWESVEDANPYFLNLTTRDAVACYEATQCKMPLVRVDWFVFAASKPPLYHTIICIPATDKELEATLKVNVEANIDQEQAIRAAFNRSGVSQNNRLIERHKSPYGSYWKSYDFGGNVGQQNLFEHPLGPGSDGESFRHDGGELIFTLPNGLQGYMLADSQGQRIDKGPTAIVSDPKQPDKTVTNGVSCMSCHYMGVIPKTDEIGAFVRANPNAFKNADDILALYREPEELSDVLAEDAKRFAAAMEKIGITSLSRSGEPVSTMAARFEQELDLQMTACEFGFAPDVFTKRLKASEAMARSFGALLVPGGTIKRDVFAALFAQAAVEFGLTKQVPAALTASSRSRPSAPARTNAASKPGEVLRFSDMGWGVQSLAYSPNGNFLAAGKSDRALQLFDAKEGAKLGVVDNLRDLQQVKPCLFSPDGSKLLASGRSGQVVIWDVSKEGLLKPSGQFVGHSKELNCLAISGDGRFAVSGGRDNVLRYWQIDSGKELGSFAGFKGAVKACHISSNGRNALATDGALLLLIDLKKGQATKQLQLTRSWSAGQAAAFSPDGHYVAAGESNAIRLWDLKTGKELPKLEDGEIQWCAAFTPDSTRLVSGGSGKINVWDVRKHRRTASIGTAGSGYVKCLAVSPDNQHVAAIPSSSGQDLQIFSIPTAER